MVNNLKAEFAGNRDGIWDTEIFGKTLNELVREGVSGKLNRLPEDKREAAVQVLSQDPRPGYKRDDPDRRYGVAFAGFDLRFTVSEGVLRVCDVVTLTGDNTEDNA